MVVGWNEGGARQLVGKVVGKFASDVRLKGGMDLKLRRVGSVVYVVEMGV